MSLSSLILLASMLLIRLSAAELPCDPPCANGVCVADHGQLSCSCDANWSGETCSEFVCDGAVSVCENGGTCLADPNNSTNFFCVCPPEVLGDRCQYKPYVDICAAAHNCSGHGNCYGTTDDDPGWVCLCDDNWFGPTCEYEGDDVCRAVDYCYGHGSCTYIFNVVVRFNCTCDEGYEPLFECEFLKPTFDRCNFEGCANGGNCTGNLTHFTCDCPAGFTGLNCSETFDVCSGQCANGGTCSEIADGHYFECSCPPGYTGYRCDQLLPTELPGLECMNDGTVSGDGMECNCLPGFSGQRCEIWDACTTAPCSVNTQHCLSSPDHPPGFVCVCEEGWGGEHCDVDYTQCTVSQVAECSFTDCDGLAGNGICDEDCNSSECGFDGFDCFLFSDPWELCPKEANCSQHFRDGVCHVDCNSAACLYDGGDCFPSVPECKIAALCIDLADNSECNPECNTLQCPYDAVDCLEKKDFAMDLMVLVLYADRDQPFRSPWREEFLGNLSHLLNAIPVVQEVEELSTGDVKRMGLPAPGNHQLVYRVQMKLDISVCNGQCVNTVDDAVRLINATVASGHPTFGPYSVSSAYAMDDDEPSSESNSSTVVYGVIGAGMVLVILALLVVGVLIGKRKRVTAKIWRPKSPSDSSPGEVGGATPTAGSSSADAALAKESENYIESCTKKSKMDTPSGQVTWEDVTDGSGTVIGQRGQDRRQWTTAHRSDVGNLVKQYKRVNGSSLNINAPGPGGFTPLMLVVMRRPGTVTRLNYQSRSSSESSSDDQTALLPAAAAQRGTPRHMMVPPVDSTVSALLEAKANLDAVNDYNQTALHLAASCSQPQYVDQLVEAGANPNIQDNWGQTPLHAAIGAGAEGAFMVLVNCPRTKINVKSDGGITPLMSAVKMVNGFMVKQLLKKDAEIISSTDDEGRTAVHWAAMVDNIEALRMLVKCGSETIKDAQDNKGQTPLFLACREGSVMCVKHLLDCFANVTLLDSLEQSPLQIAMQKHHTDIVELLRASSHGPLYSMRPPGPHGTFLPEPTAYPAAHHPLVNPPPSKKKKKSIGSTNNHFHKFQGQGSFPTASSSHGHTPQSMAMSELQTSHAPHSMAISDLQHSTSSTMTQATPTLSYANQQPSPPNYPPAGSAHSPPLPQPAQPPHCQQLYTPTSNPAHYSMATPTTSSGYSDPSPPSYDPHQMMSEEARSSVSSSLQHTSAVLDNYPPLYPTSEDIAGPGTRPLQHLPVVSEADIQAPPYVATHHAHGMADYAAQTHPAGGAGSPPQSGGSISQRSPPSAFHPGHSPNSTSYGASPQSLTPSPESQHSTIAVGTVHGTVQVEGYGYPHHHHSMHQQFMGSTPV